MIDESTFKCAKCGFCCKTLLTEEHGMVMGLSLTEEETKLFNPKLIAPFSAIGNKEPETIIFYQLTLAQCPHINEKNECRIYEKRPLICKVFPITPKLDKVTITPRCTQVGKSFTGEGEMCPLIFDNAEQEEALEKINLDAISTLQRCKETGSKIWVFNLATKRWIALRE